METVADIMERDVVVVHPDDEVATLLGLMREHELPGVPVVDDSGRLVGIVTEADLVIKEEDADLHLPHHIDLMGGVIFLEPIKHYEERLRRAFAATVADMMTSDPVTVAPDQPIREAARLIAQRRHNRLPVVDPDGQLLGVVTRLDVLEALTR
jgi:CBS domain-containing protein